MLIPLVFVLALHADQNDAAKLFHQMETKVTTAKTLDCTFDVKLQGKGTGDLKGELTLGEGNKFAFEMSGEIGGKQGKSSQVSNGVQIQIAEFGKEKQTQNVSKEQNEFLRAALARSGLVIPMHIASHTEKPGEFNIDKEFKVSDLKLGKKEKVGDHEAQVIDYNLQVKDMKETIPVSVWVDTKTDLPLKRVITTTMGKEKVTITETYSKLNPNEKVENKKFELPK